MIIPEEAPLADDVDFEQLARFEMTGGNIKSAVFRAASRAALRGEGQLKQIRYKMDGYNIITILEVFGTHQELR